MDGPVVSDAPERPLVAVAGPTGSGKSGLALAIAKAFHGEVVNCDSLQVFRHFDIGTAKLPPEERRGIPHHLIDIVNPDELFTAGEYARLAREAIAGISARGRLPIVAGGTGFYLRALLDGLFEGPARDQALRGRLAARELRRPGSLHRLLTRFDAVAARSIHPNDVPKVTRALEVTLLIRRPVSELFREGRSALRGYRTLKIGLLPERAALYERLDLRCAQMFEGGLVEEVRHILSLGFAPASKPFESHGYKQALQLLQGELNPREALFYARRNTRNYAKRQITWFRKEPGLEWLRGFGDAPEIREMALARVAAFLSGGQGPGVRGQGKELLPLPGPRPPAPGPRPPLLDWNRMLRLLLLAALFGGALRAETVLVLPFFNHSNSANLDWIGESVSETVRDSLSSEGLLALDREDRLEAYRRLSLRPGAEITHASIIKIGESLDASTVIYGYYELLPAEAGKDQSKGSLRITARILDLQRTRQGPAIGELGALEDLAAMEVRLGWQALEQLHPKTAPPEEEFLKARPPVRLDAMESYVRGLLAASPEQRHRFFTQAARLDAHYSQPCFQLGKIYWEQKDYGIAAGWLERVSRSDPHYLEAQFFLGLCRYNGGDFKGAEQAFQIVAASVPLNEVYNNLGAAQAQRNDSAAAGASFRKALEGDDADPDYHFNLGCVLWQSGQYAAAVESFRAAVARNPDDAEATVMLGRALKQEGPRPGDPKTQAHERLKTNYEEAAYRQLQAELGAK